MEPTKHQYDFDAATVLNFLREHGLIDEFKVWRFLFSPCSSLSYTP